MNIKYNNNILVLYLYILIVIKYFEILNFISFIDESKYFAQLSSVILSFGMVLYFYKFRIISLLVIRLFIFSFDAYTNIYGLISAFTLILIDIAIFEEIFNKYNDGNYGLKKYFYLVVFINILLINFVSGVAHVLDGTWFQNDGFMKILLNQFYSRFISIMKALHDNFPFEFEMASKITAYAQIAWSVGSLLLISYGIVWKKIIIIYGSFFFLISGVILEISYLPFLTFPAILISGINIWNSSIFELLTSFIQNFKKQNLFKANPFKNNIIINAICIYSCVILISWIMAFIFIITPIFNKNDSTWKGGGDALNSYVKDKNNSNIAWLLLPGNFMGSLLANVFNRNDIYAYAFLENIYRIDSNGHHSEIYLYDESGRSSVYLKNNFYLYTVAVPLGRCLAIKENLCLDEVNRFVEVQTKIDKCQDCKYYFKRIKNEN
jgi:hypothetical protein